jgi:hypothetical protein
MAVDRVGLYFAPPRIAIQTSQALGIGTLQLWLLFRIRSADGRRRRTCIPAKQSRCIHAFVRASAEEWEPPATLVLASEFESGSAGW